MFVPSVRTNSTRPAAMSPDTVNGSPPARWAMKPAMVPPPFWRILARDQWHLRQEEGDRDRLAQRAAEAQHASRR